MKKKIMLIVICILVIVAIALKNNINIDKDEDNDIDIISINRAQVAKQLSLVENTKEEINALSKDMICTDTNEQEWYYKYVNAVHAKGYLTSKDNEFRPMESIDYFDLEMIMEHFEINKDEVLIEEVKKKEQKVPIELWDSIYQKIIEKHNKDNALQYKELVIIGTAGNVSNMLAWQVVTDEGKYSFEGLLLDGYLDYKIKVLTRGNEIILISEITDKNPIIKNVWIIKNQKTNIEVFINGIHRTYSARSELSDDINAVVADLSLSDKKVTKVDIKPSIISGKVLAATKEYIEIERYGKVYLSEEHKIYKVYNELAMEDTTAILVGYSNTDFVVEGDKICATLIKGPITAKNIRVLIKNKDYKSMYHDVVEIISDSSFTVYSENNKKSYKKDTKLEFTIEDDLLKEGRVTIVPDVEGYKIKLLSLERTCGNPSYRGSIELVATSEGILIVNELSIEEYLYAVIPSEMPTSYGLEALKVQSVCARSYAYNQLNANLYNEYGAHVDDSTNSQVYNNIAENENSILAVKETYGNVLSYGSEVITAYYFSTSYGHTSDVADVWQTVSTSPIYLTGKLQADKGNVDKEDADKGNTDKGNTDKGNTDKEDTDKRDIDTGDTETEGTDTDSLNLDTEEGFKKFLNSDMDVYDKAFAWFRWNVTITLEGLTTSVDKSLGSRYKANPNMILTLDEDGTYISEPIKTVGKVKSIKITKRGNSGIIKEIIIKGEDATIKVLSEYNIRALLAPLDAEIIKQDNSTSKGFSLLPSGYFYMVPDTESESIKFIGGGYGHGVGMSQNGVKSMIEKGYDYQEILKHYYTDTEISYIYEDKK